MLIKKECKIKIHINICKYAQTFANNSVPHNAIMMYCTFFQFFSINSHLKNDYLLMQKVSAI